MKNRSFRWAHALFTYLVPLNPFIILWDGEVLSLDRIAWYQNNSLSANCICRDERAVAEIAPTPVEPMVLAGIVNCG